MKRNTIDPNRPWALMPEVLHDVVAFRAALIAGDLEAQAKARAFYDDEDDEDEGTDGSYDTVATSGRVAVIPVQGILTPGADDFLSWLYGGTSYNRLAQQFTAAAEDDAVDAVVLDIDSPGGTVELLDETCDVLAALAQQKPVIAAVNTLCASAAYYLASQAQTIVATKTGWTGSIGVYVPHTEHSAMRERMGIKTTLISAGKYKVEGNAYEPLTDEARAAIQDEIDLFYGWFLAAVARGRGTTPEAVRAGYGEGRVLVTERAIAEGLVDRQGSIGDAIDLAAAADLTRATARAHRTSPPRGGGDPQQTHEQRLRAARVLLP